MDLQTRSWISLLRRFWFKMMQTKLHRANACLRADDPDVEVALEIIECSIDRIATLVRLLSGQQPDEAEELINRLEGKPNIKINALPKWATIEGIAVLLGKKKRSATKTLGSLFEANQSRQEIVSNEKGRSGRKFYHVMLFIEALRGGQRDSGEACLSRGCYGSLSIRSRFFAKKRVKSRFSVFASTDFSARREYFTVVTPSSAHTCANS